MGAGGESPGRGHKTGPDVPEAGEMMGACQNCVTAPCQASQIRHSDSGDGVMSFSRVNCNCVSLRPPKRKVCLDYVWALL